MARRTTLPTRPEGLAIAPPVRTCVGCGVRTAKSDLLRVVAVGNEIVPDAAARLPGRGAYLHPSEECLVRAQRRRAIPRALRLPGPAPAGAGAAGAGPSGVSMARLAGYLAATAGLPPGPGTGRAT